MDPLNLTFLEDRGYGTIIPFFWANENAKLTPEYTGTLWLFYAFLPAAKLSGLREHFTLFRPVHLEIYRLCQGYSGNLCQFLETDHTIGIYMFHQGYPGN